MPYGWCRVALAAVVLLSAAPCVWTQEEHPRIEVGSHFTYLKPVSGGTEEQAGFGGRLVWNVNRIVGLEGELNYSPTRRAFESSAQGGHYLQGLFGVKVGVRKSRWGVYGKARAGFLSFGDVIKRVDVTPVPSVTNGRLTEPVLDIGGVVEFYPWRRLALRYDLGDTIIFYRARDLGNAVPPFQGLTVHSFQFSSGLVFRF